MKDSFQAWLNESSLYGQSASIGIAWMSLAPLLPVISSDFHLTTGQAGLLTGLIPLCLAVGSLLSGFVGDYLSLRRTLILGGWVMGIFSLLSGSAPNYQVLLVYRLVTGLGAGLVFPNIGCIIMQWFSEKKLAVLNAVNVTAPAVGISFILFSAPIMYSMMGWRSTLYVYAAVQVFFAIFWSVVGREKQQPSKDAVEKVSLLKSLSRRETILLSLNMFGVNAAFSAIATFLPSYLVNEGGYRLAEASAMTSIITLTNIVFGIVGGIGTAFLGLRKPFIWGWGVFVIGGGVSLVFLSGTPLLLALFLFGIGTSIGVGPLFTVPTELGVSEGTVRSILSMMVFIGFIGAFVSPVIVGVMQMNDPAMSFKTGFIAFSGVAAITVLSGLLIKETGFGETKKS